MPVTFSAGYPYVDGGSLTPQMTTDGAELFPLVCREITLGIVVAGNDHVRLEGFQDLGGVLSGGYELRCHAFWLVSMKTVHMDMPALAAQ